MFLSTSSSQLTSPFLPIRNRWKSAPAVCVGSQLIVSGWDLSRSSPCLGRGRLRSEADVSPVMGLFLEENCMNLRRTGRDHEMGWGASKIRGSRWLSVHGQTVHSSTYCKFLSLLFLENSINLTVSSRSWDEIIWEPDVDVELHGTPWTSCRIYLV